jgi:SAM-dependent methyltransferase
MSEPTFDFEGAFDEDYLYFYADRLDRTTDSDTELIWQLLELEPGMEVLDLACGHGRIATRLAQRGCHLTGLDSSPLFLHLARQDAQARAVAVDYVHGDMRDLPWSARFDRIINWFTAFGYFDDADNRRVLAQAAAALKPGGRLGIEMMNYPSVLRHFAASNVVRRGDDFLIDQHRLDVLTNTMVIDRTIIRDGRTRHVPFFVRMFTYTELRDWLLGAGFSAVTGHGSYGIPGHGTDQNRLTIDSGRMIVIAHR